VAVALRLARIGEDWSHKASTPFNKNMVGDDGPFRHGPNELLERREKINLTESTDGYNIVLSMTMITTLITPLHDTYM